MNLDKTTPGAVDVIISLVTNLLQVQRLTKFKENRDEVSSKFAFVKNSLISAKHLNKMGLC